MINIEMSMSKIKKNAWDLRVGDIDGSVKLYNATKEDILEVIAKEMDTHMEAVLDKS